MCYSIPGKVIAIKENIVSVDYFGEDKKAKNDFFTLKLGDYVYAQGGFVVQKISEREALPVLESWKELFVKLQEADLKLSQNPKTLYQRANYIRNKYLGNACCIHGIIEFSNYCRSDCLYCGIRKSNTVLKRYRMEPEEIVKTAVDAVKTLGFKALVLQSGEDTWYDDDKLVEIVKKIREKAAVLLVLSIGERGIKTYQKLYDAGARGALLRFETSNPALYEKMRPAHKLAERVELLKELREMGYLTMTGFLIGTPGQTDEDIQNDIKLTASLGTDMFSFGPFIPHPGTPLGKNSAPGLDRVLSVIANTRLSYPEAKILVTTAMETLDKENGMKFGLLSGGNSLMVNLTPAQYQRLYDIYPDRAGVAEDVVQRINSAIKLLYSLGRAPADLGL
ncbi:MAG: [FeFe] hydrogenase H-cluster radical SAM maturase HydE [Candidatus Omnitrophica bacterium]|nr:[FeFe] hydrogenase H-cluster radical SAM maturase HydE [Candidatus Omnitrophota bacterium]MDD5609996.1 [FeFe] hydrogenase H-cluster radical SAM maturase HydE [Candidatus Omnitrophota bacterium]